MEYILLSHAFDIPIYAAHFLQLFVISPDIKHLYYGWIEIFNKTVWYTTYIKVQLFRQLENKTSHVVVPAILRHCVWSYY